MRAAVLLGVLALAASTAAAVSARATDDRQNDGMRIGRLLADVNGRTKQLFVDLHEKSALVKTQEQAVESDLAQIRAIAHQLEMAVPVWMGADPVSVKLAAAAALYERDVAVLHGTPEPVKYEDPMRRLAREMLGLDHGLNHPDCTAKATYFPASSGPPATEAHVHFFWLCTYNVTTIDLDTGGVLVDSCTASAGTCQVSNGTRLLVTTHGAEGFIDAVGSKLVEGTAIEDIIPISGDGSPTIDDVPF